VSDDLTYAVIQKYQNSLLPDRDPVFLEMEAYARDNDFPILELAAGQLCYQIASMIDAKHIFEMGSGYGYSTAWFARALKERYEIIPDTPGIVYHVVWDEAMSKMAQDYLQRLGYQEHVEYHIGEAVETLDEFEEESLDLIFCDIDKETYPEALPVIKEKLRPGGALLIDNMLWYGRIFDKNDTTPSTEGVREFTRLITADSDWIVSLLPVGDGAILAYKR